MPTVTPQTLTRTVQDFLSEAAGAVVLENGAVAFDLAQSKYSISGEYNRCLLHLWSAERNSVRRVLEAEVKNGTLRLAVQRLGQARPSKLEICRERDRRTPTARRAARAAYEQKLRSTLDRSFPEFKIMKLTTGVDLEKSFGPVYTRGLMRRGRSAFAVLGVNAQETQSSIDAALTFGILWLDVCRQAQAANVLVEGLKMFVPAGTSALAQERMANLNREAAKWALFELDERHDTLVEMDCADRGNVATRLVHATDDDAARERFKESITRVHKILPNCEVAVLSAAEIVFRWRGLEFARARLGGIPGSFRSTEEIVFGVGAEERVLEIRNEAEFTDLANCLRDMRHPYGPRQHPLWRLRPERWLESLVMGDVSVVDDRLDPSCRYSQIPAFSASDRAMIDVLTATHAGRLAVVELKADEDIHLPLQGLDYWSRVEWHHSRGEFPRFGYFEGRELPIQKPSAILSGSGSARASVYRHTPALPLARNRMGVRGHRRTLARGAKGCVPKTTRWQNQASMTVNSSSGPQTAVYNSTLKAPECATVGTSCDSSATLLNGRDHISGGAEPNQPNTINNSCADGTVGTYHSDESNDRLVITSTSGSLTHGTTATVTATVWAYSAYTSDALDLYYAANANSPSWVFIKTIVPTKAGSQSLSATFTLPTGSLQAVRAVPLSGKGVFVHDGLLQRSRRLDLCCAVGLCNRLCKQTLIRPVFQPTIRAGPHEGRLEFLVTSGF